jgi:hypothetical protein
MHACLLYSMVTMECEGELTVGRLGLTMGRPRGDSGDAGSIRRTSAVRPGVLVWLAKLRASTMRSPQMRSAAEASWRTTWRHADREAGQPSATVVLVGL